MEQLKKVIAIQEFDFYSNFSKDRLLKLYKTVCPENDLDLTFVKRVYRRKLEKEIKKKCEGDNDEIIDFVFNEIEGLLTDEVDELLIKIIIVDILNSINKL